MTVKEWSDAVRANVERVMVGKRGVIDLALAAVAAGGHLLLEDVPGTGKTTLARALAESMDAGFKRVQFTPDLLPQDLIGVSVYRQDAAAFEFRKGPLFTNVLLADEINRATPRTQSGLLEAMEEGQITADGNTYRLEEPFFVVATQNPVETAGTFPLPEAQLDRFLMRLTVGYPGAAESAAMLKRFETGERIRLSPVCAREDVAAARRAAGAVFAHEAVVAYIVAVTEQTRADSEAALGASPRGALALLRAAKACAAIRGADFVTPDDVKAVAPAVLAHRLILKGGARYRTDAQADVVRRALEQTPVPTERYGKE